MITPSYVRTMAAYNSEMNRRLYAAASRLSDDERRRDRGAFWHSLHGTLVHILWGDGQWMSRFDGWERPQTPIKESDHMLAGWDELCAARVEADRKIETWAGKVDQAYLDRNMTWFSGAAQREVTAPYRLLITHFFNHQTHHRGQAHALITAAGEKTDDTDLFLVIPQMIG
ncbi:MAG TPA: DinB family protein [Stellaceae bacterium]|nr:DinB family protein [Stellaceae bacterium]